MNHSAIVISLLLLSILGAYPSNAQYRSSHDRTLPIEISADKLEVKQRDQVAIFTGQVDAQQGDIRIRAETLRVHYMTGEKTEQDGQEISRIDAVGRVFFSSKRETARSEEGMYDVNKGIIVLKGSVVLTQGNNVIRGNYLVLNRCLEE